MAPSSLENLYETIRAKVPRLTRGKKIVVECLLNSGEPLTAHEIFARTSGSDIDLATIYRNLEQLEKVDVITKVEHSQHGWKYALSGAHHSHSIHCVQCGRDVQMNTCMMHDIERMIAEQTGFAGIHHTVNFTGSCPECQQTASTLLYGHSPLE